MPGRGKTIVCRLCNKASSQIYWHNREECPEVLIKCISCSYTSIRRSFDHTHCIECGISGSRGAIEKHMASCPNKTVSCAYCGWYGLKRYYDNHKCIIECVVCESEFDAKTSNEHVCDVMIVLRRLREEVNELREKYKRIKRENNEFRRSLANVAAGNNHITES